MSELATDCGEGWMLMGPRRMRAPVQKVWGAGSGVLGSIPMSTIPVSEQLFSVLSSGNWVLTKVEPLS